MAAATSPEGKKIGGSIWVDFAPISDETADRIQENTGIDVHGYGHALDGSSAVHILNRHGEDGTSLKDFPNQVPLSIEDLKKFPDIVENADVIESGRDNGIVFKKRVNGHFIVVEGKRNRLKKLIPVTMWKELAAGRRVTASPRTSETLPTPSEPVSAVSPSNATLPPPEETVKTETPTIQTAAQAEAGVREPEDKGPEPFYNISIPAKSKTHHFAVEKSKYSGQFNILRRDERIDSKGRSRVKFVDIGHFSPYTGEFSGSVAKGSPKTILGKLRGQLLERLGKWKDLEEEPKHDPKPQVQDDSGTEALAGSVELVENDAAPSAPGEAEERSKKGYARLSDAAEISLDLDEGQGFGVTG